MKNSFHKFEEIKAEARLKPCIDTKIDFLGAWYDLAVTFMHKANADGKKSLFSYYANLSSLIGAYHKKVLMDKKGIKLVVKGVAKIEYPTLKF